MHPGLHVILATLTRIPENESLIKRSLLRWTINQKGRRLEQVNKLQGKAEADGYSALCTCSYVRDAIRLENLAVA